MKLKLLVGHLIDLMKNIMSENSKLMEAALVRGSSFVIRNEIIEDKLSGSSLKMF